jgi:4-amino-4-deoxy-L-arabinose transferase-like glycosyltransferase
VRALEWFWARRRSVGAVLLALCVLRAVGLAVGAVNVDEIDFALVARAMHRGAFLYRDVVDNKPPLTYLAFWPVTLVASPTLLPMWPIGVAVALGTCLVLRRAASLWTGDAGTGWLAAWCAVLAMLCELPSVNAELLMNLPAALALAFVVWARRGGPPLKLALAAGLAVGLASLFKQQALFLLPALAVGLLWREGGVRLGVPHAVARLLSLGLVAALPWAATLLYFSAHGARADFLEWVVTSNFTYLGRAPGSAPLRLGLALLPAVGAPLLLWVLAVRESLVRPDAVRAMLVTALYVTWVPVCLGGRFYEHYFLQFVPPLSMLAAAGATRLTREWPKLARPLRAAVLLLVLVPPAGYLGYCWWRVGEEAYPTQDAKVRTLASWLRDNTRPEDTLFVWGDYAPVYWLANRNPGTRYIMTAVHAGNFDPGQLPEGFDVRPYRDSVQVQRTLEDLEVRRPRWVVDTAPADIHYWARVPLGAFPELDGYVLAHYSLVAKPSGAAVYVRKLP